MFVQPIYYNAPSQIEQSPIDFLHPRIAAYLKTLFPDFDETKLQLKEIRSVTWNDGSLGCPMPGLCYTQALVPGYLIEMEYMGTVIEIHTDSQMNAFALPNIGFIHSI